MTTPRTLVGRTLDLKRLPEGWTSTSTDKGVEVTGRVDAKRRLSPREMLEYGVFAIGGGQGMPVAVRASIQTTKRGEILDVTYKSAAYEEAVVAPPVDCETTNKDIQAVYSALQSCMEADPDDETHLPTPAPTDAEYKIIRQDAEFVITKDGSPVTTPAGRALATPSKELAERLVQHLCKFGEQPGDAISLVTFHFSYLDFFNTVPRPELERSIALGLDEDKDWTFTQRPVGTASDAKWVKLFGTHANNASAGKHWLSSLPLTQLCAVCVIGRYLESVNIPYILATQLSFGQVPAFAKDVHDRYPYMSADSILVAFGNFLFYFYAAGLTSAAKIQSKDGFSRALAAIEADDGEALRLLIEGDSSLLTMQDKHGLTLAHWAAYHGTDCSYNLLYGMGSKMNTKSPDGVEPIHLAAQEGHTDTVRALLQQGGTITGQAGKDRNTPLHFAARGGHLDIVRLLVAKGADVNARCNGECTALHLACMNGHSEVVSLLIECGADVNAANDKKAAALHYAAFTNMPDVVRHLLKAGAKRDQTDIVGRTPLQIARAKNNAAVAKILSDT